MCILKPTRVFYWGVTGTERESNLTEMLLWLATFWRVSHSFSLSALPASLFSDPHTWQGKELRVGMHSAQNVNNAERNWEEKTFFSIRVVTYTWPVSWATTKADEKPSSWFRVQLLTGWHMPVTGAYPVENNNYFYFHFMRKVSKNYCRNIGESRASFQDTEAVLFCC